MKIVLANMIRSIEIVSSPLIMLPGEVINRLITHTLICFDFLYRILIVLKMK